MDMIGKQLLQEFNSLRFNAKEHLYDVGGLNLKPVSNIIKDFVPEFDTIKISGAFARKHNLDQREVIKNWEEIRDEACEKGTDVHDFGERYVLENFDIGVKYFLPPQRKIKLSPKKMALVKFWDEKPGYLMPVALELRMYLIKYGMAGTADIILFDIRDNSLVIADYKTNKNLFNDFGNLLGMCSYMPNNPFSKYTIQLSLYQIMLEEVGYKVSNRILIWLKEDGSYKLFDTYDMTDVLREYLDENYLIYKQWLN